MAQAISQPSNISASRTGGGNVAISERVEYILKGQNYQLAIANNFSEALRVAGKRSLKLSLCHLAVFFSEEGYLPTVAKVEVFSTDFKYTVSPIQKVLLN